MANKKKKKKKNPPNQGQAKAAKAKKTTQAEPTDLDAADAETEVAAAKSEPAPKKQKAQTPPKDTATPKAKQQAAPRRRMPQLSPAMMIGMVVVGLVGLVYVATSVFGPDDSGVTDSAAWDLPALDADNDPDGDGRITLAEFEGKPVVVNFFASWCVNCERELPRFVNAEDNYSDQVAFVYVNSNETGDWKPMAERTGIRERLLARDIKRRGSGLHRSLGGTGSMPMTAYYDANGNLAAVDNGEVSSSQLDVRLQQIGVSL